MKQRKDRFLLLIAIFKFFKAAMLIALGLGAFRLIHRNIAEILMHWVDAFKLDPGNRFVDAALSRAAHVTPSQIRRLGLGSFLYAALFLAEGTGLWLQKRWGEWLTVIITSSLVPGELYEIYRHPTSLKFAVLAVNVGIVAYLIVHMRKQTPR